MTELLFFQKDTEFFKHLKFFHVHYPQSLQYQIQSIPKDNAHEIFRQAVYCLLTPATKSDSADYTYRELFTDDFFYQANPIQIAQCLCKKPYIRFHNQKTDRLIFWRSHGMDIVSEMIKLKSASSKREYLISAAKGFGLKESTHFLRNIGMSDDLVIMDRHIVSFMKNIGLIGSVEHKVPSSRKLYLLWESVFQEFIHSKLWLDEFGETSVPHADFAVWAAGVALADSKLSPYRILQLR
ncbi:MAG: hypothetical protein ACRCTQ_01385 [Brevinemataceae bacterium]